MALNDQEMKRLARKNLILFAALLGVAVIIGAVTYYIIVGDKQKPGKPAALQKVESVKQPKDKYDVIVVGTDPEGVMAAISASRNGLKTLLVDGHDREILGGLMTLGWLNSLDHNYNREKEPLPGQHRDILNKGLFSEWYKQVEGDSFDVVTAANAFYNMVKNEKNIDLHMKAKAIEPLLAEGANGNKKLTGIAVTKEDGKKQNISAQVIIDATQDADIAAAAGVPYTVGREDIGDPASKMAVTVVFRLNNITPERWKQFGKTIAAEDKGQGKYGINDLSLWGFEKMQQYPAVNKERVRMRGLNGGRQNDNTMLVNALQIFGVDPFDPKSRQEAFQIAKDELPHVLEYLKKQYPEFEGVELEQIAPELYVRESRHIIGEYRLNMIDVLENRDQWDRIAFGSYPVDIQRISPTDNGAVMSQPTKYAIPFRSIVPLKVDGLLVVGRSASFDTLPHGSARVIPVGMATGEAAGAAAKVAIESGMSFRQLAASKEKIAQLQDILNRQGMDLKPFQIKPQPYMEHKAYEGLKAVVSMGLATGGYNNNFALDDASNAQRFVNLMQGVRRVHKLPGDASAAVAGIQQPDKQALTLEQAAFTEAKALGWNVTAAQAVQELQARGYLKKATVDGIADKQKLSNGDTYMMVRDLVDPFGKKY